MGKRSRRRPPRHRPTTKLLTVSATVVALLAGGLWAAAGASATVTSQFTVVQGAIRMATGTPLPATGTQAALWSNSSYAMTDVSGSGRVVLGAIGTNCAGWPTVRVSVDGRTVGDTTIVDATRYGAYPVGTALAGGDHSVKIQFVNDRYAGGCDRNVFLGYARMESPTALPVAHAVTSPAKTAAPTSAPAAPARSSAAGDDPPPTSTTTSTTAASMTSTTSTTAAPTPSPTPSPSSTPSSPTLTSAPASNANLADTGEPGPDNTGVPDGTKLTVRTGDLTITQPGTVLDGVDLRGFLRIQADNVTVRNSIIRGRDPGTTLQSLVEVTGNHPGVVIQDSTLAAATPSGYIDGLKGHHFTARRLDVSKVVDTSVVYGDNVTIQDSWFHDNFYVSPWPLQSDNQTHNDSLQIEGGNNILVEGNNFEGGHNSALMITQNFSRTSNVKVVDNHLADGGCTVNIDEKGKGPISIALTDNVFGPSRLNCAVIGPPSSSPSMVGNVLSTGAAVVPKLN